MTERQKKRRDKHAHPDKETKDKETYKQRDKKVNSQPDTCRTRKGGAMRLRKSAFKIEIRQYTWKLLYKKLFRYVAEKLVQLEIKKPKH